MTILTDHYVCYALFRSGLGHGSEPTDFDGACDAYAGMRDDGHDAAVFEVTAPVGSAAASMIDVTSEAEDRIRGWIKKRHGDIPEWLDGEAGQ